MIQIYDNYMRTSHIKYEAIETVLLIWIRLKTLDFRFERTLSVGRAVSLLGRFAPLRGLTCPAHPTGVAALHSNQRNSPV